MQKQQNVQIVDYNAQSRLREGKEPSQFELFDMLNVAFSPYMRGGKLYTNHGAELTQNDLSDAINQLRQTTPKFAGTHQGKIKLQTMTKLSASYLTQDVYTFPEYTGQYSALDLMSSFFTLRGDLIDAEHADVINRQLNMALAIFALQHLARLRGMYDMSQDIRIDSQTVNVEYSMLPILASTAKGIGKSSFLRHLMRHAGTFSEKRLEDMLMPTMAGREMAHHDAIILDEISPYMVMRRMDDVKGLATMQSYTLDEKFENAVDKVRQTALLGSTNKSFSDFAGFESERRIQIIPVDAKDQPLDYESEEAQERFAQFWAELNQILDYATPAQIRHLTRWSVDLTLQGLNETQESLKEEIATIVNDSLKNQGKSRYAHKLENGDMFFEMRHFQTEASTRLLDGLNIKYTLNGQGELEFSTRAFAQRFKTAVTNNFQNELQPYRNSKGRGFKVHEPLQIAEASLDDLISESALDNHYTLYQQALDNGKGRPSKRVQTLNERLLAGVQTDGQLVVLETPEPVTLAGTYQTGNYLIGLLSDDNVAMLNRIGTADLHNIDYGRLVHSPITIDEPFDVTALKIDAIVPYLSQLIWHRQILIDL